MGINFIERFFYWLGTLTAIGLIISSVYYNGVIAKTLAIIMIISAFVYGGIGIIKIKKK